MGLPRFAPDLSREPDDSGPSLSLSSPGDVEGLCFLAFEALSSWAETAVLLGAGAPVASMGWRLALGISLTAECRSYAASLVGLWSCGWEDRSSVLVRKVAVAKDVSAPSSPLVCSLRKLVWRARDSDGCLFPQSKVKRTSWITSVAPHPSLGGCVQPFMLLLFQGVGILLAQCPVGRFGKGGWTKIGFQSGHESFCFSIKEDLARLHSKA